MEESCEFVSSSGLLYSCDVHARTPQSSSSAIDTALYVGKKNGTSIYVCNNALRQFLLEVLPLIDYKFILVSGDADCAIPFHILNMSEFQTLVSSPYLLHWYCQNFLTNHPSVTPMPIGIDYHTLRAHIGLSHPWGPGMNPYDQESLLKKVAASSKPLAERRLLCYSNFHHGDWGINTRGDRQELLATMNHSLIAFSPHFCDRVTSWREALEYAFVLSPRGGGYDCHRTWEALALGCIPIVRSSPLDKLFEGLPVLIVDTWSSITIDLLQRTVEKFSTYVSYDKLYLRYWTQEWKKLK